MAKTNLSNWSINLLKSDNVKWYTGYVLGQRDDEFYTRAVLGNAFHLLMEVRNKTGELDENVAVDYITTQCQKREQDKEVTDKLLQQIACLYTNLLSCLHSFVQTKQAEEVVIIEINETYNFKAKIDALHTTQIQDYKTVHTFTKQEEREEKYGQQAKLYQYAVWVKTGNKLPCTMTEILKRVPTFSRKTKDELVGMCKNFDQEDSKLKKDEIIEKYRLIPSVCQHILFDWNNALIDDVESLLKQAMYKADWLRSIPSLDLVL